MCSDRNKILFIEKQRFTQWWLWLVLLAINGLFLFGLFKQVIYGQQFGNKPMSNGALILLTGFIILLSFLVLNAHLDTVIKKDGIYLRFFPFHLKFKYYAWSQLTKSFVRVYSPIKEYGGWGLRLGLFGKGTAFNISGNQGLQLEFTNNKKLLVGTNKPEELSKILSEIGKLKQ